MNLLKAILCLLLSTLLALPSFGKTPPVPQTINLQQLRDQYPKASMHSVSPKAFEQLKRQWADQSLQLIETPRYQVALNEESSSPEPNKEEEEEEAKEHKKTNSRPSFNFHIGHLDPGSGDGAAIVFVVIGLFVVAAFVVYTGKYLYDVARSDASYQQWIDFGWNVNTFGTGVLSGVYLATGFEDQKARFGLSGEVGYLKTCFFKESDQKRLKTSHLEGAYALAGPSIRWLIFSKTQKHYFTVELLGGTASPEEAGLISVARAGINFGLQESWRIGLQAGALYLDLKETDSVIKDHSDFQLLIGVQTGYRF